MAFWDRLSFITAAPMADGVKHAREKLKVFISYSRRDAADLADELVAGLELAGFTPLIDRQDIVPGEPWEGRESRATGGRTGPSKGLLGGLRTAGTLRAAASCSTRGGMGKAAHQDKTSRGR
jgi:hypothetical protein